MSISVMVLSSVHDVSVHDAEGPQPIAEPYQTNDEGYDAGQPAPR